MKPFLIASAAALLAAPALAQDNQSYDVQEILIEDYLGVVTIETGGANVTASLTHGSDEDAPRSSLSQRGGALVIAGDAQALRDDYDCSHDDDQTGYREDGPLFFNGRRKNMDEANTVRITAPAGVSVRVVDSLTDLRAGEVRAFDLDNAHCATVRIVTVAESTRLHVKGIADVEIGATADLDTDISGVGSIEIGSVNGAVSIAHSGVGSVEVDSGTATRFTARLSGIGDVDFGGHAINPEVRMSGIGSIDIESYEGNLTRSRSGIGEISANCTANCSGSR